MELVNTYRGVIRAVKNGIVTIALRRGGTSKAIVNRKFTVGQVVCFTVDPVHLNITNVMLKSEADKIVLKAHSEEARVADMSLPDGLLIPEIPDFGETDPVEAYYGKEGCDDIDELLGEGPASQEITDNSGQEDRVTLIDGTVYFGDPVGN